MPDPIVRVVHESSPTVGGTRCCIFIEQSLCWLLKDHHGPCFPLSRMQWVPNPRGER